MRTDGLATKDSRWVAAAAEEGIFTALRRNVRVLDAHAAQPGPRSSYLSRRQSRGQIAINAPMPECLISNVGLEGPQGRSIQAKPDEGFFDLRSTREKKQHVPARDDERIECMQPIA